MIDFCLSIALINVLLITRVSGIPLSWQWWVLKAGGVVLQLLGTRFIVSQLVAPLSVPSVGGAYHDRMSHIV